MRHAPYWKLDKRNGDVEEAIRMDEKIDAVLLDVWHDFPEKVNISSENDVIDFAWGVNDRVWDTLEEDKFVKELKANKAEKYQDEPWRVA